MSSVIERMLAVVATASLILMASASAQAQGRWLKLAPFPDPMEELFGVTANGKMYVMGGFHARKPAPGVVYEYDPSTDQWTQKKTMALPAHHIALTEYRGKIYVFGGLTTTTAEPGGWEPIDNSWEYDPAADSWKALAPLPGKRGSAVAAEVGGKIYVIGGATTNPGSKEAALFATRPHRSVGTNQVYDPATNKWETRNPMPTARNHMAVGAVGGKIYVIGGRAGSAFIGNAMNVDLVEEYDPATDQWGALRQRMPTARSAVAFGTYGGRIYVAGGEGQTVAAMTVFRALEAFDPATNKWTILPSMPLHRHGFAGAFIGNRLHLVSGQISPGEGVSTPSHDVFEVADQ